MVSPEVLAEHMAQLSRLEDELEAERKHRRAADGEIIKLRAAMGGVQLSDSDVNALLPKAMESLPPVETDTIDEGDEDEERLDERYVILLDARAFFRPIRNRISVSPQPTNGLNGPPCTNTIYMSSQSFLIYTHMFQRHCLDFRSVCSCHLFRSVDITASGNHTTNACCIETIR